MPSEALDLLETIEEIMDKLEKAKDFQSRIDGIDRDADKFKDDVLTLLEQTAPDLKKLSPDQAALQLYDVLGKAKQAKGFLKKNKEEIEALAAEAEDDKKNLQSMDERLAALIKEARCVKSEDLAEVIRKSVEHQRLHDKISDAKSSLAKVSEGISLEEIKHQADEVNIDELQGQIESLRRQIDEELKPRIEDALKLIDSPIIVQVHRSYAVSMMYIKEVDKNNIILKDETCITLGKKYVDEFMFQYREYLIS